jgi:anti-sigma factor RsiW
MDETPPNRFVPWDLLDRYLAGEAGADERARVEAILESVPDARQTLHALRRALEASPKAPRSADVPTMFARLQARLAAGPRFKRVVYQFFDSSPERALAALLELDDAALTPEQTAQVQQLIDRIKQEES